MSNFQNILKTAHEAMNLQCAISIEKREYPCPKCLGDTDRLVREGPRSYVPICKECGGTGTSLSISEVCEKHNIDEQLATGKRHET